MTLSADDEVSSIKTDGRRSLGAFQSDTAFMIVVALIGLLLRLGWALHSHVARPLTRFGEAQSAAIGLATNGFISSPYRPPNTIYEPDGLPTAHLLPIPISIAAGVYHFFGIESRAAIIILTVLSTCVILTGFTLLYHAFAILGLPRLPRLGAFAALCLVPLNAHLETEDFRYWEGGYAVMLAAALLLVIARLDTAPVISISRIWLLAVLNAVLFFISPQFGIAGYVALALFAWLNIPKRRWPSTALIGAIALASLIVPWTIRNEMLLGKPIFLRSNLGLELALAFHDGAVAGDERTNFERRYSAIHPNISDQAYARMKAEGGEDLYAKDLGRQTKAWMRQHPWEVARLGVRHLVEYLFPPIWTSKILFTSPTSLRDLLWQGLMWFYSFLGIAGCFYSLVACNRKYYYASILMLVTAVPYVLVQPIDRYHYLMYGLSVYFTFLMMSRMAVFIANLWRRRA